jgi:hypothetical protein
MFEDARSEIVDVLSAQSTLYAVGLIRRGYEVESSANPLVLLVTGKIFKEKWNTIQSEIRTILAKYDAKEATTISIELFEAEVLTSATSATSGYPVPIGDPISVANLPWAKGSLGGFFRLSVDETTVSKDDPRLHWVKQTYALSCHHVLRPTRPPGITGEEAGT